MVNFRTLLVFCLTLFTCHSYASVVINGTRVIYNEGKREVQVQLRNPGKEPYLIQSWVDDGDVKAMPADISVPFTLSPPISRIEPESGHILRLFYTGGNLPKDAESVFWLNVLAAPGKSESSQQKGENYLQFAFRTRIKLFFRPAALSELSLLKAADELTVTKVSNGLKVVNPTPYHFSFSELAVTLEGVTHKSDGEMVAPQSSQVFQFSGLKSVLKGTKVKVSYVNDYGGISHLERVVK